RGGEVLRGDQLEVGPLVGQLGRDRGGDLRCHLAEHVHGGRQRGGCGPDLAGVGGGAHGAEIRGKGGVGVHGSSPCRWRPPGASYPRPTTGVDLLVRPILRVTNREDPSPPPPHREEVKRMTHLKSRLARAAWTLASLAALAAALGAPRKW